MEMFEQSIKRNYTGDDQDFQVELQNVEDNPSVNIEDELITIKAFVTRAILKHSTNETDRTMVKTLFDHVIGQIMHLVGKQVDQVKDAGNDVKVRKTCFYTSAID